MTQPSKPTPLRVGVIGAGWPGERHAEGYLASGLAQVVAVSDLEATRRAAYGKNARASDFLEPLDPAKPLGAWPHTLWLAPGTEPPA